MTLQLSEQLPRTTEPSGQPVLSLTNAIAALSQISRQAHSSLPMPRTDLILVTDDDPISQSLVQHILEKNGYKVMVADNGPEAIKQLESTTPSLMLLDIEMPGMSGLEVCQQIKSRPEFSDLPIIFLTAETNPKAKAQAFSVGGADYVTKPIERIELLARIKCHIELAVNRYALNRKAHLFEAVASEQYGRLEQVRFGQTSMMTNPRLFNDLKVAVRLATAHEAGGDFYELSKLSDSDYGFLVTDVSGHDLSVPFVTGALKALAGLCLHENLSPRETMIMLNSGLCKVLSAERYVTGCYVKFNRDLMELEVINAGHPPALIQRCGGRLEFVNAIGDVLGIYEQVQFEPKQASVGPGDRLFLYTDGLIEGYRDEQGRSGRALYGMHRLQQEIDALPGLPIVETIESLVDDLIKQSGGTLSDDVILMGIEF